MNSKELIRPVKRTLLEHFVFYTRMVLMKLKMTKNMFCPLIVGEEAMQTSN